MYEDLVEKLVEIDAVEVSERPAVATEMDPQQRLFQKFFAKVGKLELSTYRSEAWYKFWMLTDGRLIPVKFTHDDTAHDAGTNFVDLRNAGVVQGYINPKNGELNVDVNRKFTQRQITTLVSMFVRYGIQNVCMDVSNGEFYSEVKSSAELDYFLNYGTLDEAVATKMSSQDKMRKKYRKASKKLVKSVFMDTEMGRRKFWLLTDGMIISVKKDDSHAYTASVAGTDIYPLLSAGAIRGYVKDNDEMGIHWESGKPITSKQKSVLRNLFIEYKIKVVYYNSKGNREIAFPKSSEEFDYFITYGKDVTNEAVAAVKPEKQMKWHYEDILNSKLIKNSCTWSNEQDWLKFWLFKDGSYIPVSNTHEDMLKVAEVSYHDLFHECGAVAGSIQDDALQVDVHSKFTEQQISRLKQFYIQYKFSLLYVDASKLGNFSADVKSVEELDYLLRYGKDDDVYEAVEISPEKKLRKFYKKIINGRLKPCTMAMESWIKFYVLKNGDYLPVVSSHALTAQRAGTSLYDLEEVGVVVGSVDVDHEALQVEIDTKLTKQQISRLRQFYIEYKPEDLYASIAGKSFDTTIKSAEYLDYLLTYGKDDVDESIDEAVATLTPAAFNKQLKNYYKKIVNGKLVKSYWGGGEDGQRKFWLLSDGSIIPVAQKNPKQTHRDVVEKAGVSYDGMMAAGAVRGYVKDDEELGLDFEVKKLTFQQRSILKQLYVGYRTPSIYYQSLKVDLFDLVVVSSVDELDYLLQYGESFKHDSMYEAVEVPEYLYHGTFKPLLDKIKSEGLRIAGTVKNYSDSEEGLIYLAKNFEEAEAFAEVSEVVPDEWVDQIVVLKIDTDKLDKSKLADDPNVRDTEVQTFVYPQDISPEAFEVLMPSSGLDESGYAGIVEAGWIHPNGKLEEIKNYTPGDHDRDAHRKLYPGEAVLRNRYYYKDYLEYLNQGHIRYIQSATGFNIELWKEPTESQMRAI